MMDLDDCLINTEECKPYRRTEEGKALLKEQIELAPTYEISPALKEIAQSYARQKKILIVTNSPQQAAYNILKKHGFPDIPIRGAAKKPFMRGRPTGDCLIIGDSATDILQGHAFRMPSIGVTWGYSGASIELAEPNEIVERPESLEDAIIKLEGAKHKPRTRKYRQAQHYLGQNTPGLQTEHLAPYYPPKDPAFDAHSDDILRYKDLMDVRPDKYAETCDTFYCQRGVAIGEKLITNQQRLIRKAAERIKDWPKALIIPMPNSLPEFCYRIDINYLTAKVIADRTHHTTPTRRYLHRAIPKRKSQRGNRSLREHYQTLGLEGNILAESVILLDDVTTSGNSFIAAANLLRHAGYAGEIKGLAFGKTTHTI